MIMRSKLVVYKKVTGIEHLENDILVLTMSCGHKKRMTGEVYRAFHANRETLCTACTEKAIQKDKDRVHSHDDTIPPQP